VLNHIIIIPMLPLVMKLFEKMFPPQATAPAFGPIHINDGLVAQPEIALEQAKKETIRVAGIVEEMFQRSYRLFCCTDGEVEKDREIVEVGQLDQNVDVLRNAIVMFLTKVAGVSLSVPQSRKVVLYLSAVNELENLADVIDVNILDRARKMEQLRIQLHEQGVTEISLLHAMVLDHFHLIIKAFQDDDRETAERFLSDRGPFKELQAEIRNQHYQRLQQGHQESIDINPIYMDLLGHYNRINRNIIHIAKRMLD
jgi:phosphate:Na+ symporter